MSKVLIAASGTGGHIFPALSIAEALPDSWSVTWLGVPDRLETQLVPDKYEMETIAVHGLQAQGSKKIFQLIKLLFSTISVVRLIRRKKVDIVFTTGGYIAAPAIIASRVCGLKVVLHESNAFPGKVTRYFGRFCTEVALGLPIAAKRLKSCKTVLTGTPVRNSFLLENPLPLWVPNGMGPLIVVMGGSQGAVGLNVMARAIFPWLLQKGCRIVHIIGNNDKPSVIQEEGLIEKAFTEDIPGLLQHADLVISRSGAGALSELAVCNTPVIFVPYPHATDNHQELNAAYAAKFGAALIVHENVSKAETLKRVVGPLLKSTDSCKKHSNNLLLKMREGMREIAIKDSHLLIVDILKKYI